MPKTENAFALKNFDVERILQRTFFLHRLGVIHDDTDASILDLYYVANIAHLGAAKMEKRITDLHQLKAATETYKKILNRHVDRISKFESRYAEKFIKTLDSSFREKYEYANILKSCYNLALKLVDKLIGLMSALEKENDKFIQKKYREEFAVNLKHIRLARKMTQRELATRLDIAVPSLSQYENAIIEPTIKNLVRLANILGTTTDALLGRAV